MNPPLQAGKPISTAAMPGVAGASIPDRNLQRSQRVPDADREREVAYRVRRVVISSAGVLQEQKQDRSRARSVAIAVSVVFLLLMAPMIWEAADSLIGGEHLGDTGNQLSLWACIVCPTLLGAALVAGWWRRRS